MYMHKLHLKYDWQIACLKNIGMHMMFRALSMSSSYSVCTECVVLPTTSGTVDIVLNSTARKLQPQHCISPYSHLCI